MTDKLKSCPFCGFLSKFSPRPTQWENGLWQLQCGGCSAASPPRSTRDEAYKAWDVRSYADAEALTGAFKRIIYLSGIKFTGTELEFNKLLMDIHNKAEAALKEATKDE